MKPKAKGNHGERELCKLLSLRFPDRDEFSRCIGSGNRWSQAKIPEHVKASFTGDLVCPADFRFSIECKRGYGEEQIKTFTAFTEGHRLLDEMLAQAEEGANTLKKYPLLCWRRDYCGWICFTYFSVLEKGPCELKGLVAEVFPPAFYVKYKEWCGLSLEVLLTFPDGFFFTK